jgi:hypothetical protein
MTLGRTPTGAIKLKTDGGLRAVECACCVPPCPSDSPSPYGIVLTEEQYNNFKKGGNYTMSAVLSETRTGEGSCSSNLNGSGVLAIDPLCEFYAEVREPKCVGGGSGDAYFQVYWRVFQETGTNLYKLRYSGAGYCPYLFFDEFFGTCYSNGYYFQDTFDSYSTPSYMVNVGSVSLTNRGTSFQFGVWTLDQPNLSASASATINITEPVP